MFHFYNNCDTLFVFYIVILWVCVGGESVEEKRQEITEDLIPELYMKYIEAVQNDVRHASSRRLYKNNKEYKIHVSKLKEVNGFKTHNLLILQEDSADNPIIYINNPVESKIPHAYLTLEEFKKALTERVNDQRKELRALKYVFTRMKKVTDMFVTKKFSSVFTKQNLRIINKATEINKTKITTNNKLKSRPTTYSTVKVKSTTGSAYEITKQSSIIHLKQKTQSPKLISTMKYEEVVTQKPNITSTINSINYSKEMSTSENKINDIPTVEPDRENITKSLEIENDSVKTDIAEDESSYSEETEKTTITTTKLTRSTLGRPLVFMGGYQ